ncbi:hypothetical protein BMI86_07995 [Thioclava sp. DLFJ5-1]|uniref:topoisomerase DNA-binding C4 zinc finger domain-containing protein n=1 Tax=Thioclava sp. DLFJ5-1 TaxID=1915314 RepID=UPI0009D09868|nr:topoisomerase DNA-binding C4 zinc finger domain-containing protein [Thioclava sp. DLFJ5-1]OOY20474.1 hypothetical protein BMI86_07995 [Thioclava sp. DLFJ5-1]
MQEVIIGKDRLSLVDLIGKGGEGEVYSVQGRSGQAVKIYSPSLRTKRESKVRAMVGEGLAVKTDLVAYPGEVVTDHTGSFLGFAMRLVSGYRPLHELYSPKSRQRHFPKSDYRFIVHAALNVARAVGNVHQTGCVIGDLNHSGVLVAQDATVALIDADSFQFTQNGKSYPCVVGVPDFTPPELHGKNLASVERTISHDNFGLAVALFQLLFMGRHPYAGRYSGPDISMGDAIAQNRFAFSLLRQALTQTRPPPGALTLDMFPDQVSDAFERAFGLIPSERPSALDWVHALKKLEVSLNRCSKVKTHYYPYAAGGCVWCKLSAKSSFDMFPDLTAAEPNIASDERGTEQAIREILAFRFPTAGQLLPTVSIPSTASDTLRQAQNQEKSQNKKRAVVGFLIAAVGIGGVMAGIVANPLFFLLVPAALSATSLLPDVPTVRNSAYLEAFTYADERVHRELNALAQRSGLSEALKMYRDLEAAIADYKAHDDRLAREVMVMKSGREARQRQAYLDRYSIRQANISGIGSAKKATLVSFGIETAADVNSSAVGRIPGFGDVMTGKLVAWRRRLETGFRYNPTPNAQDVADEQALRGRYAAEKAKLEATIRNGLVALRNAKVRLDALPDKAKHDSALNEALTTRAQAERDLRELALSVPSSTVALTVPSKVPGNLAPKNKYKAVGAASTAAPTAQSSPVRSTTTPTCPNCGSRMVKRTARRGRNRGGQFWGCSRYPHCKGTRSL